MGEHLQGVFRLGKDYLGKKSYVGLENELAGNSGVSGIWNAMWTGGNQSTASQWVHPLVVWIPGLIGNKPEEGRQGYGTHLALRIVQPLIHSVIQRKKSNSNLI